MSLVCHSYTTRMYPYVIRMSLVCTLMSSVCYSYVLVCHAYVTRRYSYVICMSLVCTHMPLVCGFTMIHYVSIFYWILNALMFRQFLKSCNNFKMLAGIYVCLLMHLNFIYCFRVFYKLTKPF